MAQVRQILLWLLAARICASHSPIQVKLMLFTMIAQTPLQYGTCSLAGLQTFHTSAKTIVTISLQLNSNDKAQFHKKDFSLQTFDEEDRRTGRLEFGPLQNHLQITRNDHGRTQWIPLIGGPNKLEISLETLPGKPTTFNLNGSPVTQLHFYTIPAGNPHKTTVIYDETAQPNEEWLELQNDPEIVALLSHQIKWEAPIKSIKIVDQDEEDIVQYSTASTAYIVVSDDGDGSFQLLDVSSGKPSSVSKHSFKTTTKNDTKNTLPALINDKTKHFVPFIIISGFFSMYLLVLLRLSRMTSVRPKTAVHVESIPSKPIASVVPSACVHEKPNADSNTVHLNFPDAPHLKSTISTSGSVLKLTVPAALNLADNRHILFPSKLRNFQK
jgi:hypothetical protein